jgi:thermitase
MTSCRAISAVALGTVIAVFCADALGRDKLYLVRPHGRRSLTADSRPKLSDALIATRKAGGILKGANNVGQPVILTPESHTAALTAETAMWSATSDVPVNWYPVKRLKLSYEKDAKLTSADLEKLGLKLIEDYQRGQFLIVEPISKQIDAPLVSKLADDPKVQFATPTFRIKAIPPLNLSATPGAAIGAPVAPPTNDARWAELWGMRNIRAPEAWKKIHDSPVIVAVIDTGVDYTHEDLTSNIWTNAAGKHGYDFVDNDDDPMDQNGHGTHCAGTVGAVGNNRIGVVGVNWKVQIMAVRWLDATAHGDVTGAIKAIDFAIDNGARVLSNSWFWTEDDPDLEAAIGRANQANVLFVSAAGNFARQPNNNDGDNDQPGTFGRIPSAYPLANIIAVAAIDESEAKADFSEWGKKTVHLSAPGVLILSTVPPNDYDGTFSGTSMATPHVAGAAALTMARNPSANYLQVKDLLIKNARKIPSMTGRCISEGTLDISFLASP